MHYNSSKEIRMRRMNPYGKFVFLSCLLESLRGLYQYIVCLFCNPQPSLVSSFRLVLFFFFFSVLFGILKNIFGNPLSSRDYKS